MDIMKMVQFAKIVIFLVASNVKKTSTEKVPHAWLALTTIPYIRGGACR